MRGELHLGAGGRSGQAGQAAAHSGSELSPEEMDKAARERTLAFPAETAGKGAQLLEPRIVDGGVKLFELTADIVQWEIEPGKVVEAWAYNGTVPGPTIRVDSGDRVRVTLENNLKESTSVHFHGVDTPNEMDGVPDVTQRQIRAGETFTYGFVADGPAVGMYHAHSNSQVQVPMGLAGAFYVDDMPLPPGVTGITKRIPFILSDAGNLGFGINGKSFPATEPITAKLGETFMVDYYNEGLQIHPMHLHGPAQTVIAKDGFPLPAPYKGDTINIAPGERYAEAPTGFFGMTTALVVS